MSHEGNDFSYQSRKTPTFQYAYSKETEGRLILNGKAIKKSWEHQAPTIAFSRKTQKLPGQLCFWEERICLKQRHKAQTRAFWNISAKLHFQCTEAAWTQMEFSASLYQPRVDSLIKAQTGPPLAATRLITTRMTQPWKGWESWSGGNSSTEAWGLAALCKSSTDQFCSASRLQVFHHHHCQ